MRVLDTRRRDACMMGSSTIKNCGAPSISPLPHAGQFMTPRGDTVAANGLLSAAGYGIECVPHGGMPVPIIWNTDHPMRLRLTASLPVLALVRALPLALAGALAAGCSPTATACALHTPPG